MELRQHRRFRAQFRSHFSGNCSELPGEGVVHDLSVGGCRITSLDTVNVNDDLELYIFPDDSHAELLIQEARVCWRMGHEFGVAFIVLQPNVSKRLIQVLTALDV